jgi:hypothetical protein
MWERGGAEEEWKNRGSSRRRQWSREELAGGWRRAKIEVAEQRSGRHKVNGFFFEKTIVEVVDFFIFYYLSY